MIGIRSLHLVAVVFGVLALLTFSHSVQAQEPTPTTPQNALIRLIQQRAERDVQLGTPRETTAGLDILFGKDAQAVTMSMAQVRQIYDDAYAAASSAEPWWRSLQPNAGWILAGIFFIVALFRDALKYYLTGAIQWLVQQTYNQLAGYRLFWSISLRQYRRALVRKYRELKIPFRPGRPLDMREIYVPLKVAGGSHVSLIDGYQAIGDHKRLVIVGAPGSGKSMLLRHVALTFAKDGRNRLPSQSIPVLVELSRLNEPNSRLNDILVDVLSQNDFPSADKFVKTGLDHGLLILLLDGLDEVNADQRTRVVNQIKDVLGEHSECRAVITCRTAVYNEEFAEWADQKLEVVEFSDQQIQAFLVSWQKDMPAGKAPEHLVRNLRERPRIMALARNPLLLTIIAYLYVDSEFVLPHSRAEFYVKSVNVLLEQWKESRNRYKGAQKKLVLQHLALFNQDSVAKQQQDRRSIELPTILSEIKRVLPSLTLKEDDAQPILDEIVERSGLMISVDGGVRYQFTHLTLQEFFAALALGPDTQGLITRFGTDRGTWRETVKLWCGLERDSTILIRAINEMDPVTAFECLGDAQQISATFAEELISLFKARLGETSKESETVIRAIATVAADPRPRGQQLFNYLASSLTDSQSDQQRSLAAANALALTNLPQAAQALAHCAIEHLEIRPWLIQMGDLAVPKLSEWATEGLEWALEALYTIGTPQAAESCVPLLWNRDVTLQHKAAWRVAALLSNANVEADLRAYMISADQRNANRLDWVWEPFEEDASSPIRVIAGRIAYLLSTTTAENLPPGPPLPLDQRLVIPLCAIPASPRVEQVQADGLSEKIKRTVLESSKISTAAMAKSSVGGALETQVESIVTQLDRDPVWKHMFSGLHTLLQVELLRRLYLEHGPTPTRNDWRLVLRPISFDFVVSPHAWGIKIGASVALVIAIWAFLVRVFLSPQIVTYENGFLVIAGLVLIGLLAWMWRSEVTIENIDSVELLIAANLACIVTPVANLLSIPVDPVTLTLLVTPTVLAFWVPEQIPRWSSDFIFLLAIPLFGTVAATLGLIIIGKDAMPIGFTLVFVVALIARLVSSKSVSGSRLTRILVTFVGCIIICLLSLSPFFLGTVISSSIVPAIIVALATGCWVFYLAANSIASNVISSTSAFSLQEFGVCFFLYGAETIIGLILFAITYYPTTLVLDAGGWVSVAFFWVIIVGWCILLFETSKRREREAKNPLYGLLGSPSEFLPRTPATKLDAMLVR